MRLMNLYFQALRAFKKHTVDDSASQKLRKIVAHSNHRDDILTTIKYECNIDVDWIENIEEGLKFVEKAILEDRQFIRTEGEVVPIEKVRKVSKASVEHLSRHSALISRVPKDNSANLIPDKLYIVEKLSDYLVYENRFIYLLLSYIKDFVEMRLNKIKDKTTTYQSEMRMDKDIEANQRHIQYKLDVKDVYKNDPYLIDLYHEIPLVKRAETVYAIAVSLLATPLMRAVAKAPLIKPPIVKTNVLRMNPNFKAALALYDYITAYNKDGYELIERKQSINPFPPEMGEEIAETIIVTSVVGYIEGNGIRSSLEEAVAAKEKEDLQAINKRKADEIKRLKKRIVEKGDDPTEYILMVEKRNIQLEKENVNLSEERQKNADLQLKIGELETEKLTFQQSILDLNKSINDKNTEITTLNQKYFDDMTLAETVHQKEIVLMEESHEKDLRSLKEEHRIYIEGLNKDYLSQQQELMNIHKKELESMKLAHENTKKSIIDTYEMKLSISKEHMQELQREIMELNSTIEDKEENIKSLKKDSVNLDNQRKFSNAQYLALKAQQGLLTDDDTFTSKEKFKQLELEMKAYKKLFKEQWKLTKQKIRENAKKDSKKEDKNKIDKKEELK